MPADQPTLSKYAMRQILSYLDAALASVPATDPAWADPAWSIRAARNLLLEAALTDVAVETAHSEGMCGLAEVAG